MSLQPFTTVTGVGVPLRHSNVDTDQIVPSSYMKRITRSGFEDALFATWRQDPTFVLNDPRYAEGKVLIAGPHFGTGSSREHAVWALMDYGFRVIISSQFADIFHGNASKDGLLAAQMSETDIHMLWQTVEASPEKELMVHLPSRTITAGDLCLSFVIDDTTRWRLLNGLDDIKLALQHEDLITEFESKRPRWTPAIPLAPHPG